MKWKHIPQGFIALTMGLGMAVCVSPALAQEAPAEPFSLSGSIGVTSDYRFRGISLSDGHITMQGGIVVTHESGAYAGAWASTIEGWRSAGGADIELDLYAGYAVPLRGAKLDLGATWYLYPGGAGSSDFIEPYAKISTDIGPLALLAGIAYAPRQQALGNATTRVHHEARIGKKGSNLYIWSDASAGLPGTPVTLTAHMGYSEGNPGIGPNGGSLAPTGRYLDWRIGADWVVGPLILGIAYVDTDISRSEAAYLRPAFASRDDGSSIASGKIVVSGAFPF